MRERTTIPRCIANDTIKLKRTDRYKTIIFKFDMYAICVSVCVRVFICVRA